MRHLMNMRLLRFLLLLMLFAPTLGMAQQTVSGQIISQKDQSPIPGVTVMLKGANKGTSTNVDGRFTLNAKPGDILVISGVGITQQEVTVGADGKVMLAITQSDNSLNEVVVTALGVKKKRKNLVTQFRK